MINKSGDIKTSELLSQIIDGRNEDENVSLGEINAALHEKGFALLLILFSVPIAVPLPYPPGFTTILGMPLLFYTVQMMMGKVDPWLPKKIAEKEIKISHLKAVIKHSIKFFQFIEKITRPRILVLSSLNGERLIGFLGFLCAVSVSLPIMFGNAVPSLGILIMSIGLLNRDGIIIIFGILVSLIGLFISAAVVVLGLAFIKAIFVKILPNLL
jgi:hypothetical protein